MEKILAFLNKYSLFINSISIAFWLYIMYVYSQGQANAAEKNNSFYIIPAIFIIVSLFNIALSLKKRKQD